MWWSLRLPSRGGAVRRAVSVWVPHVVADLHATLAEVARVPVPEGRYVLVPARGQRPGDPIGEAIFDLERRVDPDGEHSDSVDRLRAAHRAGLRVAEVRPWASRDYPKSPTGAVRKIETRSCSALWRVPERMARRRSHDARGVGGPCRTGIARWRGRSSGDASSSQRSGRTTYAVGPMAIAIAGGTGDEGFGLALRFAMAGEQVVIGSRSREKGEAAAARAREILGGGADVEGRTNQEAATNEVVFVTVPFAGQAEIYRSIRDFLSDGAVVCDATSPLATAVGRPAWQVLTPWEGSAAEQAKAVLPKHVRLVSGLQTVSGEALRDAERPLQGDVLLCGADAEAKATVGELVEKIPNLRWVDAGALSMARIIERFTAVLVSVNRAYGLHDAGFRLTGRDGWGPPPAKP